MLNDELKNGEIKMDKKQVIDTIIEFISTYQGIEKNNICKSTNLVNEIGMSSIDIMQMCCQIEDEYRMEFEMDDTYELQTIEDVADYVMKKTIA